MIQGRVTTRAIGARHMSHVNLNPRAYVSSLPSVSIKRAFYLLLCHLFRRTLLSNARSIRPPQPRSPALPMWVAEASLRSVLALALMMPVQEQALRALSLSVRSPLASSGSNTDLVRHTHTHRERERRHGRCQYRCRSITRMHAQSYHKECII